ncbi:MAG: uncharacterized protein QOF84_7630 [Streptomyces sp.]|jgi:ketosteroid isomerase-like protein|nr:uncharacterized protein [Streptomyces sp.]
MAEHPHAALVRKGYEAFSRGDMDALRGLMTGDCTHHVPGDHPLAGDYKGVDNVLRFYGQLFAETDGSLRVEIRDLFVDGRGHVVAVHHQTAGRGGRTIDQDSCIVFRVVGDKITDLDECSPNLDEDNAFWA